VVFTDLILKKSHEKVNKVWQIFEKFVFGFVTQIDIENVVNIDSKLVGVGWNLKGPLQVERDESVKWSRRGSIQGGEKVESFGGKYDEWTTYYIAYP